MELTQNKKHTKYQTETKYSKLYYDVLWCLKHISPSTNAQYFVIKAVVEFN